MGSKKNYHKVAKSQRLFYSFKDSYLTTINFPFPIDVLVLTE